MAKIDEYIITGDSRMGKLCSDKVIVTHNRKYLFVFELNST